MSSLRCTLVDTIPSTSVAQKSAPEKKVALNSYGYTTINNDLKKNNIKNKEVTNDFKLVTKKNKSKEIKLKNTPAECIKNPFQAFANKPKETPNREEFLGDVFGECKVNEDNNVIPKGKVVVSFLELEKEFIFGNKEYDTINDAIGSIFEICDTDVWKIICKSKGNDTQRICNWINCKAVLWSSEKYNNQFFEKTEFCGNNIKYETYIASKKSNVSSCMSYVTMKLRNKKIENNEDFVKVYETLTKQMKGESLDEYDEEVRIEIRNMITRKNLIQKEEQFRYELNNEFILINAQGDGACLFNAIAACLNTKNNIVDSNSIRQICCDVLDYSPELLADISNQKDKKRYIEELRSSKFYADSRALNSFNKMFQTKIVIYEVNKESHSVSKMILDDFVKDDVTIFLRFEVYPNNPDLNHYDCLRRKIGEDVTKLKYISDRIITRFENRMKWDNVNLEMDNGSKNRLMMLSNNINDKFMEIESKNEGNGCMFEAICNSFGGMSTLIQETRKVLGQLVNDNLVDIFNQKSANADEYRKNVMHERGGNFELKVISKWAECRINIYDVRDKKVFKTLTYNPPKIKTKFTLTFLRNLTENDGHILFLRPKKNEYFEDFKAFKQKADEFNDLLVKSFSNYDLAHDTEIKIPMKENENIMEELLHEIKTETDKGFTKQQVYPVNDIKRKIKPDQEQNAVCKTEWIHPDKVTKENRGTLNIEDFKSEFGIKKLHKFEDVASKLRRGVINDETLLGLEKNIYFAKEVPEDEINSRYLIEEKTAKQITLAICMQCSGYNERNCKSFKVIKSMWEFMTHCRSHHNKRIAVGNIINLQYPDYGSIIETKQGSISTFWLVRNEKPVIQFTEEVDDSFQEEENEEKKKCTINVKKRDISNTKTPEKKNPFDWINAEIKEVKKKGKGDYIDIVMKNKDRDNKADMITFDEKIEFVMFEDLIKLCKNKKDHNVFKDEELVEFKQCLPHNVRIDMNIPPGKFKYMFDVHDRTSMVIGPCIDIDCSGMNVFGEKVYRVFNSLFELKKHCSREHHDISEGSVLLLDKPEKYTIVELSKSGKKFYLMKELKKNTQGKVSGRIDEEAIESNLKINIFGHNIRSAVSVVNKEMLNRFLDSKRKDRNPSILMLNESGDLKSKKLLLKQLENDYGILTSGTKTAIIFDKRVRLNMIFDKLNDEHNQICVIGNGKNKVIIYNTYLNPGTQHKMRIDAFKVRMDSILGRYKDAKIIVFGDFNLTKEEFKIEIMNYFKGVKGIKYHIDPSINAFTRCAMLEGKVIRSYLDYMITVNIESDDFDIEKPIGNSDHWMLHLALTEKDFGQLNPVKELRYNFSKAKEDAKEIKENLVKALEQSNKIQAVVDLVRDLRKKYRPRCKKVSKNVTFREKVTNIINDESIKNKWDILGKTIRKLSNEEYNNFMCDIEKLNLKRNWKEYFLKLRFYSEINRSSEIMKNLEIYDKEEDLLEILTEKALIDNKVSEKYRRMFEDGGTKEIYKNETNGVDFTAAEVRAAMENLSYDKATSWDYIPGEVFKLIHKENNEATYRNIASFINQLMKSDESIPEEILSARLMCLNKCPGQNGNLDNIRPISITGMFVKIIERVLLTRIEVISITDDISINKSQVGFVKGLGCDVNIMRLRQRANDVLRLNTKDEKYIFFIDLKAAYDSVNHKKLFCKLMNKRYPVSLIDNIKKIYSSARMRLNLLQSPLNINKGVMQGGILSPWLFNIYIDDLITEIQSKCFEILAYADDLAVICKSPEELYSAMEILERWSMNNDIAINKNKSGILIIDQDRGERLKINGYPLKLNYKYLGIKLDRQLNPMTGLMDMNKKLDVYVKRNSWLIKQHFTPKSLVTISQYYQYSRIGYGMSCFLDVQKIIDTVESHSMKYTKSILGLSNQVNSNRLRLILNRSLERHMLWVLLRKNIKKYKIHFEEDPWIYNAVDMKYLKWLADTTKKTVAVVEEEISDKEHWELKRIVSNLSKRDLAAELGIEINENYSKIHKKCYFMAPDKRDGHLIRYLLDFGFYKTRFCAICKHCGSVNSRSHVTNDCEAFSALRERVRKKLKKVVIRKQTDNLEELILYAYYNPVKERLSDVLNILRDFAICLIIRQAKLEKGEKDDAE